jgi:hypothetical protein
MHIEEEEILKAYIEMSASYKNKTPTEDYSQFCDGYTESHNLVVDLQQFLVCNKCGLFVSDPPLLSDIPQALLRKNSSPLKHLNATLLRLQALSCRSSRLVYTRYTKEFLESLKDRCNNDFSLKNIHKNLENRDQKYLNYFYSLLTGKCLSISSSDQDFIKHKYQKAREFYADKNFRCYISHILDVLCTKYERLNYISDFLLNNITIKKSVYEELWNLL